MLGVTDYGAFVIAIIVFLLIPGPGNLALITSTSKGGVRGGLAATLGVILGDQFLMWMAVAGVAASSTAYPRLSMRCNGWVRRTSLSRKQKCCSPNRGPRRYCTSSPITICARRS